ncbi:hypothetical protein MTR67_015950 [Solanum verrucosum]|uniref:D-3-phosphoglycerate dehydrogenase n=1 Tax=Solanum verrucosum TaxID=315347 RepID=A0AAF0QHS5_SOLVR|nr:hypothetical protein MTR67_015950 [Solanum verrucosum]
MASTPSPHTAATAHLNSLLSSSSVNHNKPSNLSFLHASSNPYSIKFLHSVSASSSFSPSISSSSSTTAICNVLKTVESADISLSRDLHGVVSTSKPTILVSEKLGEAGLDLLRSFGNVDCSYDLSPQDLCAKISLCDALIVRSGTKVTREVFEAAQGRLKVVGRAGVGIDNVDLQAATEFGCLVVNAPTANTIAAAEHGIALLTSMARNVAQSDASMKAGKWLRSKYVGVSLVGKTLAIMGFGKVGSEVARRAKGLGMHVIAHDPYAPADRARAIGVDLVSFEQAISTADFISLHMPLTPATNKVFNDDTFPKMKKGVRLINVARGGVIDEDALVRALDSGIVAQAALDVFTVEPPPKDSKLVQHENVTVTPHLGASTKEAQEGVAIEIAEAVVGALNGELSATAVNAPMVPPEVLSELAPYVVLAEKLGRLAVQLVTGGSGIQSVKVVYKSARDPDSLDTRLLRAMVTKGIIEPISDTIINLVNADFSAKQKGLRISEERIIVDSSPEYPVESIQVQISNVQSRFASALSENGNISIEGKVKYGVPHLTRVGPFSVDVSLEGNLILCKQVDQPGMIGKVGNILGESNVNVSFMSVGRTVKGKQAIMAIGVDEEPDKDTQKKIGEMAGNAIHPFHQQWPPAPAPPLPSGPPPHHHHHSMPIDEVRTIFISGLPQDVKERELVNLLRWLPGYEASQLNFKGELPMGFALFSNHQCAIGAKEAIQGLIFDTEGKCVLHTEMAKKNLFVKRGIVADSNAHDQSKRMRTGGDYTHSGYSSPSPFHPPPAPVWAPHGYITQAPPPYNPYGGYPVAHMPMAAPAPVPAPSSYAPVQNTKDNPPCNTLFIGNLGENINEEELRGLISGQPGFKQMKVLRQERHTVCFIEFEDVNSATNVHHSLQGAVIPSSGSVGMRIQYPFFLFSCLIYGLLELDVSVILFTLFLPLYCFSGLSLTVYLIVYIFKESIWEKEGLWPPSCCPQCKWSSSTSDILVAAGDVFCSLCSAKYKCIMQLLHASLLSSSHEHYHLDMNIFLDHIIVYPRHAFEAQSSQHCQLIQGSHFVTCHKMHLIFGLESCWFSDPGRLDCPGNSIVLVLCRICAKRGDFLLLGDWQLLELLYPGWCARFELSRMFPFCSANSN